MTATVALVWGGMVTVLVWMTPAMANVPSWVKAIIYLVLLLAGLGIILNVQPLFGV